MPEPMTLPEMLRTLRAFQPSRVLLTALELDLLPACAAGADAAAVAARIGADPRATAMLLNALAALGVVTKDGEQYRCTPVALALDRERAGLLHLAHLWETWSALTECVRTGTSARMGPVGGQVDNFIAAMHARATTIAGAAVRWLGGPGMRRMLDVGGGPATFAIACAQADPDLRVEVLDLGPVLPIAQEHIRQAGLEDRITAREGDLRTVDLGEGYDLVLVSAICHMLGEAENQDLLNRCAKALRPGGRVAIREFILDPDRAGPPVAALFALNMLVGTTRGNTYTEADYRSWLVRAGFRDITRPDPEGDWLIATRAAPGRPAQRGFFLVEFLLAASVLAVGLLGLTALQVATVRGNGLTRTRMTAAALANSALESALAEARRVFLDARRADPESLPDPGSRPRKFTAPQPEPWVQRYDRDGLPPWPQPPFYTVTMTRSPVTPGAGAPASAAPAPARLEAREFQVTVAWEEGAPAMSRSLTLSRIIAY